MARLGVVGWPVAHSRSPAMHEAALAELGLSEQFSYQRLPIPPELLEETVRALPGAGFAGVNVTVPHKQAALRLADEASARAMAIGAANTLSFRGGRIAAENTDAPGFMAALPAGSSFASALVLGAGGSARAIVWALRQAGCEVAVWNRTLERGRQLADEMGARAVAEASSAELLVNCTTVGLDVRSSRAIDVWSQLPLTPTGIAEYRCVVDMVYRDQPSELLATAAAHGSATVNGLEVLVRQGALSLELWTGREAPLEAMRAGARRR